jgi:hypothetical protein
MNRVQINPTQALALFIADTSFNSELTAPDH